VPYGRKSLEERSHGGDVVITALTLSWSFQTIRFLYTKEGQELDFLSNIFPSVNSFDA